MGRPAVRFGLLLEGRPLTGRREKGKRTPWILGRGVFMILISVNILKEMRIMSGAFRTAHEPTDMQGI